MPQQPRDGRTPSRSVSPTDDLLRQSFIERKIEEAIAAGEFDDLPGAGKPISDLDLSYDPSWWVRKWVKRERVRDAADELRRTVRREVPRLRLRDDEHARARLEQLRQAIDEINEHLDVEDRIAQI
jgi:anion-transporting  ArsA/GET3 family ATPase